MATAPTPGSPGTTDGDEKLDKAKVTLTMELKTDSGEVLVRSFRPAMVPFNERALVRKRTKLPLEAWFPDDEDEIGEDMMKVWWWLASRAENPMCTFEQAEADWPEVLEEGALKIDFGDGSDEDGEDDSPEA